MDVRDSIVMVSIFGRGHYLATELVKAGIPVTLLDVSQNMGQWYPEDIEGPFGFFNLTPAQLERLQIDEVTEKADYGFTLWLGDGPFDLKSTSTDHRLRALGLNEAVVKYLSKDHTSSKQEIAELGKLPFEERWLASLSPYFTSSIEVSSVEAYREGLRRDIFQDFYYRKVSPYGLTKSLQWCEKCGVRVLKNVEIKDLVFEESQNLVSLEVRTDRPGILQAEQLVFCLTAEESSMISLKVRKTLFGDTPADAMWAWLRYRIKIGGDPVALRAASQLPNHCLVIDDIFLPWTHNNCIVVNKAADRSDGHFDTWVKLPNVQRFNSQYLLEMGSSIAKLLESKIPGSRVQIDELPLESKSTFQQLGPPRHPIFSRALLEQRKFRPHKLVHFDSPEYWQGLSWEGQFQHQDIIFNKIKIWWKIKEELRIKKEMKQAVIEARKRGGGKGADL